MRKNIYSGYEMGVYNENGFNQFLVTLFSEAEKVYRTQQHSSVHAVYMLPNQGVALHYDKTLNYHGRDGCSWDVTLIAFGQDQNIGEVEKKILEGQKALLPAHGRN
jgi:hypothetical protein